MEKDEKGVVIKEVDLFNNNLIDLEFTYYKAVRHRTCEVIVSLLKFFKKVKKKSGFWPSQFPYDTKEKE